MKRTRVGAALLLGVVLLLFMGPSAQAARGGSAARGACYGPDCPPVTTTTTPGGGGSTTTPGGGGSTTTPPAGPIPTVTAVRGQSIDVTGDQCAPGSTVVITFDDGRVLATVTAGPDGTFSTTITVPSDATLGTHLVTATCGDRQQFLNVNVVSSSGVTPPGGEEPTNTTLARTGTSNIGPLLGIGAAAVVLGAAFLYGAKRPKEQAQP